MKTVALSSLTDSPKIIYYGLPRVSANQKVMYNPH